MKRLLTTQDQRQLELIQLYRQEGKTLYTLQDLAHQLGCSQATISSDLDDISQLFEGSLHVTYMGRGVIIDTGEFLPDNFYFRTFARRSLNFRILNELFYDDQLTVDQMSDKLYASRSSIYRSVKEINSYLSSLSWAPGLSVSTSPLSFQGPENSIRLVAPFFVNYYYSIVDWPFPTISQEECDQLFDQLSRCSPYLQLFSSNPIVQIQLATNFDRYANGHLLQAEERVDTYIQLKKHLQSSSQTTEFTAQGKPYDWQELLFQLTPGLVNQHTELTPAALKEKITDGSPEQKAIQTLQQNMLHLKEDYHFYSVGQEDRDLIALTLFNLCQLVGNNYSITIVDSLIRQNNLQAKLDELNPHFIKDIQSIIKQFIDQLGWKGHHRQEMIDLLSFYFLMVWPNTVQELSSIQSIDLLLYTGNYHCDLDFKVDLENMLPSYVHIHTINRAIDFQRLVKKNGYDIIMTYFHLPLSTPSAVYYISGKPDMDTYLWLYKTIRKLQAEQREKQYKIKSDCKS